MYKILYWENNVVEFISCELNVISIKLCLVFELFVVKVLWMVLWWYVYKLIWRYRGVIVNGIVKMMFNGDL